MGHINKITASALAMVMWSGTVSSQTLVEATSFAIGNSPDVAIVKNQYLSRIEQMGVSKAGYKPTVDLALGWGGEWTDSPTTRTATGSSDYVDLERGEASLTMSQLLYDGLRTKNNNDRTKAEAEAHRFQLWNVAENTTLEVADAYMTVIHAQEESVLAAANLEAHIEILDGIRKRSEHGLGSASDLSQVKGRLSRAHTNYLATDNNVLDAKARYYKIVGQEAIGLVKPESVDEFLPISYDQALERAGRVHPTLQSAQLDVDAAVAQLKTRDSDFHPDVRLELGGTWNNNIDGTEGYTNDLTAMIRMRYNLFNGNADSYRKKEAYYQLMEASAIRDRAQREVAEGMSLSWNAYQLLERQMEFLEAHVIEAEKTLDAYKQQFSLGRRTLVDLLDAENELFEARRELLSADKDRVLTQFRVLNAMGELLSVLNLDRESVLTLEDQAEVSAQRD
ncbi:channel protein TolC [Amphritea opalescens]|uniref:Channel protein TolC n=1 Tax=Amphritea opalescens TaxID=2490544 RepID=A0A430KLC3_9GAMM|nr:TolC family outer membrane protein [Amphritea opalescens]RTE64276.1 channel protein TolC [Amphritea opalescens]